MSNAATPTIRPAAIGDLPAIVAMRDDLNALELQFCPHAPIQKLSVDAFQKQWGATLTDSRYCWRVVEYEGQPIGFGLIYLMAPSVAPSSAFIHWAYLKLAYRQRGWGRLLLEHMLDWARGQSARRVELQFIEGNLPAERFWTEMGFQAYARKCVRSLDG
jgi:GNAT superfamily N-acetyltransferase